MTFGSDELARLSPDARRALLARLLAGRATAAAADAASPCSYGQRSLWFMHQLAPSSAAYNVALAWRIRSAVDAPALHRAVAALVARHDVLRTTYEIRDHEPWQRVHARMPDSFETRPIGPCDEDALTRILLEDSRRPFDLVAGPMLRATLYTLDASDHVLLIAIHHIACDLWSVELLFDDLGALYRRESGRDGGTAGDLPPVAGRSYREFIDWQRAMIDGEDGRAHWDYWRQKLGGNVPRLDLPTDRPRPPVLSFDTADVRLAVPPDLVAALRVRAAEADSTLFPVFLGAFQALLLRYSGQDSVLVGTAASGRSRRDFEPTVGYFVNPVVFRCDADDDPTFVELVRRTRADVLAALDHQDLPFPLVVERLKIDRDPARSPLSDAYFVWDKTRDAGGRMTSDGGGGATRYRMDWHGLALESFPLPLNVPPSDVAMVVFDVGQTIAVTIGYNTTLFDRATVERFGRHFLAVLRAVAADPTQRVSRLPLVTAEERETLRHPASTSVPADDPHDSLSRRFARHASTRPDAVAVTCANRRLTYRELDDRANVLAARLRAAGAGRDRLVGLRLDRDLDLVVAVLAVLKAGAAYLPIDAGCPEERIAFMLSDAGACLVVSSHAHAGALAGAGTPVVFVDDAPAPDLDVRPVDAGTRPDDLAYVIYTSGSTGRPKGVMVTHRNVLRLFDATAPWFRFDARDVWTLFHSIAFDFSVWELWGALLHGGRLVVVPFAVSRSPEATLDLLAAERVTVLNQTPSAFGQLMAADQARAAADALALRLVIFGGEALDVRALRPWFDLRGDRQPELVNMFGITETTVHVTYRPVTRADLDRRVTSPIGVAIPDLRLFVLDPGGTPVPPGVPGELYVAGDGVSRGYLHRPELDAARFLPDPTSTDPAARLYRTGDLVRRDAQGALEYLGRIDQQVKIRGFRIELGEIQAAVARHPAVEQSAVIVRRDVPDDPRLVAYVVIRPGATAAPGELQAFVRRALPDYMVPGAFVRIPALPLTANAKLDTRALPAPDQAETSSTRPYAPPRTDVERAVAGAWARLLRVDRVGVDDDFFELGGHSILATGLTGWVREHFRIDFPIYAVFESPTVAGMARRVETLTVAAASAAASAAGREEFEL